MTLLQRRNLNRNGSLGTGNRPTQIIILLIWLILSAAGPALAAESKPLWLSLAPARATALADAVICELHAPQAIDPAEPAAVAGNNGRPAGKQKGPGSYGQRPGQADRFESEHRPKPVRNYWLNLSQSTPDLTVSVRQPDGSPGKVELKQADKGLQLAVFTPMGEGPAHGAHNIYTMDRQVIDNVLEIRVAKWLAIHHSCGWGHDHRFDDLRQTAQADQEIPLEIVIDDLWDSNFHSRVMAGDILNIRILSKGQPVAGAKVTVTSDKGWSKTLSSNEEGGVRVQLIRDYYPTNWPSFNRDTNSAFTVEAVYANDEPGLSGDTPYAKTRMSSTFAWRYYPARQDYQSYAWGLGIALLICLGSGIGIYAYRERRKKPRREIVFDE